MINGDGRDPCGISCLFHHLEETDASESSRIWICYSPVNPLCLWWMSHMDALLASACQPHLCLITCTACSPSGLFRRGLGLISILIIHCLTRCFFCSRLKHEGASNNARKAMQWYLMDFNELTTVVNTQWFRSCPCFTNVMTHDNSDWLHLPHLEMSGSRAHVS